MTHEGGLRGYGGWRRVPAPPHAFLPSVLSTPDSQSCCWEPHMLVISLNTSYHLTQQRVVFPTDPIQAKRRGKAQPALHPFISSQSPLFMTPLHASTRLLPSLAPLIPASVQSHRCIDWMDAFRPCPLSSSSWLELEQERKGGRWWGYLRGSLRLMSLDWKSMTPAVACRVLHDSSCPNINVGPIYIRRRVQYEEAVWVYINTAVEKELQKSIIFQSGARKQNN